MKRFKKVVQRLRYPLEIMLLCVRWYLTYSLSYRDLEEMMQERGVSVDHTNIYRWVIKIAPLLESAFRKRQNKRGQGAVPSSWRMDETYIKIAGKDRYLYRAVDKQGKTVDSLVAVKRDRKAAQRFFSKAINHNGIPLIVNMDKSGANKAGLDDYTRKNGTQIQIRQCTYLNNMVEQDHRTIKRRIRAMLGVQTIRTARIVLSGIDMMHMLRKGQFRNNGRGLSRAKQFEFLVMV